MKTVTFSVEELECTTCANVVLKELAKKGFNDADVDIVEQTVTIEFDESEHSVEEIMKAFKSAGFNAEIEE